MNKHFFLNLLKEGIGYESGLLRTITNLYKNPQKVVEASVKNDLTYVNPVKFMMTICGYVVFINGFIIDWEKVILKYLEILNLYVDGTSHLDKLETNMAYWMGIVYSTGLVPFAIIISLFEIYYISKKVNSFSYSLDYHKNVIFYYNGLNMLMFFLFTIPTVFLPIEVILMTFSILLIFALFGYRKFVELKPVSAYFSIEKSEITDFYKGMMRKVLIFLLAVGMSIGIVIGFV